MKPQCESTADCLEQLARVMRQFGFTSAEEAARSKYVKRQRSKWISACFPSFIFPEEWQFAIAEVEDRPVFLGNVLYDEQGRAFLITEHDSDFDFLWGTLGAGGNSCAHIKNFSWNPPSRKEEKNDL
jgi:hypothetical protein